MAKTTEKEATTTYLRKKVMKKTRVFAAKKEMSISEVMEKALLEYMENHK